MYCNRYGYGYGCGYGPTCYGGYGCGYGRGCMMGLLPVALIAGAALLGGRRWC